VFSKSKNFTKTKILPLVDLGQPTVNYLPLASYFDLEIRADEAVGQS
jgi:hypothetical protein